MSPVIPQRRASVLLESIDADAHMAQILYKSNPKNTEHYVNSFLKTMKELIQRAYNRYIPLEFENDKETPENHSLVTMSNVSKANIIASPLLLKIIAGQIQSENEDVNEFWTDTAAVILGYLSAGVSGAMTRTWHISYLNSDGDRRELEVLTHETSFSGIDVGLKTWGAAPFLAQKLVQKNALSGKLQHRRVLELGSGTGLVGLVCDKLGAAEVRVTDYHRDVLANIQKNVALNVVNATTTVSRLDFIEVARQESTEWQGQRFDLVVASDLLYEMEHAEHLPVAVDLLMENEFYFLIPLRSTHWDEVELFERRMTQVGLHARVRIDTEREEDGEGMISYRYYEFIRTEKTGL